MAQALYVIVENLHSPEKFNGKKRDKYLPSCQ
jgi:hypothetical protein